MRVNASIDTHGSDQVSVLLFSSFALFFFLRCLFSQAVCALLSVDLCLSNAILRCRVSTMSLTLAL